MDRPLPTRRTVVALLAAAAHPWPALADENQADNGVFDFKPATVTIGSVKVPLTAKAAYVPVRIDRPVSYAMHVHVESQNGSDPNEAKRAIHGYQLQHMSELVVFQPGETQRWVKIDLKASNEGRTFNVVVADQLEPPTSHLGPGGHVTWAAEARNPAPAEERPVFPKRQSRGEVNFSLDIGRFQASDSGMAADGARIWRTVLPGNNRAQPNNGEPVIYTDPVLHPGTRPFEVKDGVLHLRAEKLAKPLSTNGRAYGLGASVVTTDGLFETRYGWVSAELKLPTGPFAWPGFWLYGHDGNEIDIMETFRANRFGVMDANAGMHWRANGPHPGGDLTAKIRTALLLPPGIDLTTDFHEYAVDWRPDWTTWFIDGHEVYRARTTCHGPLYVLLDMTLSRGAQDAVEGQNDFAIRKLTVRA